MENCSEALQIPLNGFNIGSNEDMCYNIDPQPPSIFVQIPLRNDDDIKTELHTESNSGRKSQKPEKSQEMLVTARPKNSKFHKCPPCGFITLNRDNLEEHNRKNHDGIELSKKAIKCPGCSNIFYFRHSLEVHLSNEHSVLPEELNPILEKALSKESQPEKNTNKTSRIYIKSVDVLRNPIALNRQVNDETTSEENRPIYQDISNSNKNMINLTADNTPSNGPKQKIYLKNVNELQDQQIISYQEEFDVQYHQNSQPLNLPYQSHMGDFSNQENLFLGNEDIFPLPTDSPNDPNVDYCNNNEINNGESFRVDSNVDQISQSKNKIYIKNVQTLIQEPVLPNTFLHLRTVDELNLMNLEDVVVGRDNRDNIIILDELQEDVISNQESSENFGPREELDEAIQINSGITTPFDSNDCVFPGDNNDVTEYPRMDEPFNFDSLRKTGDKLESLEVLNEIGDKPGFIDSDQINSILDHPIDTLPLPQTNMVFDLNTPVRIDESENVICLPDESDDDISFGFPIPIDTSNLESACNNRPKQRIFVASNLIEGSSKEEKSSQIETPKKNRGRPKGAATNKPDKTNSFKCNIGDCGVKMSSEENIEYHRKCHNPSSNSDIRCPECKDEKSYANWNTLHTHLWRNHSIDMELYSCSQCQFKTPIQSRLYNTHILIHSQEKNFKCNSCDKKFKNQRQLKNHRRIHRTGDGSDLNSKYNCKHCKDKSFDTILQLRRHTSREHCNKASKMHKPSDVDSHPKILQEKPKEILVQSTTVKEKKTLVCESCGYKTKDHNAFRRHKMGHDSQEKYKCEFCSYKSIQSTSYKNHLRKNHSEEAELLIFKCNVCTFESINENKFNRHKSKHEAPKTISDEPTSEIQYNTETIVNQKIKVKSDLLLQESVQFNVNDSVEMLANSNINTETRESVESTNKFLRPAVFAKDFIENTSIDQ